MSNDQTASVVYIALGRALKLQIPSFMKIIKLSLLFAFISCLAFETFAAGPVSRSACRFSTQPSSSKEERDNQRIACLKEKARTLTTKSCLRIAQNMEYSTSSEESRLICLNGLSHRPSAEECLMVTRSMEFADSADESRWTCLLHKGYRLNRKQCLVFAEEMQYPANSTRAKSFCENHLK